MPVDRPLLVDSQGRLLLDESGRLADPACCCELCFTGSIAGSPGYSEVIVPDIGANDINLFVARCSSSALTEFNIGWGAMGDPESLVEYLGDPAFIVAGDTFAFDIDQDVPANGYLQIDIIDTNDGGGGEVTLTYSICYTLTG